MRRFLVITIIGMVAVTTTASAAAFHVGDHVIASGSADVVSCTNSVAVTYYGSEGTDATPFPEDSFDPDREDWVVDAVKVETEGTGCGQLQHTLVVLDATSSPLFHGTGQLDGDGSYLHENIEPVAVSDIEKAGILIQD
jgi:hypothetical protein